MASEFSLMAGDLGVISAMIWVSLHWRQRQRTRQDISLLHQSTGWDARLVATAANAAKVSAVTLIAHDALYGVLRAGLPQEPEALAW